MLVKHCDYWQDSHLHKTDLQSFTCSKAHPYIESCDALVARFTHGHHSAYLYHYEKIFSHVIVYVKTYKILGGPCNLYSLDMTHSLTFPILGFESLCVPLQVYAL